MSSPPTHEVTRLLLAWGGDAAASGPLMALAYEELRSLARSYLRRERSDHTLQPTALMHEAYLRLVDETQTDWQGRAQFYGLAARVMRQLLVDHARRKGAAKRGGLAERIPLEAAGDLVQAGTVDFVALDSAPESRPRLSEAEQGSRTPLFWWNDGAGNWRSLTGDGSYHRAGLGVRPLMAAQSVEPRDPASSGEPSA